jgi:DNA-binding transcriptional regulator/RsmH inhibitor MraZ
MTIIEQIESLKSQKSSARSNSEFNSIEKKIMKLAKMHNAQNHYQRYFIYNGNVYGLEKNPNYLN